MFIFNSRIWSNRFPATSAFEKASGIYTPTEISAIQFLEFSLKQKGLFGGEAPVYPCVGGTALSNSINLKNPDKYRIVWNGSVTHNSNGITGDALTGYGDTGFIIPLANQNNFSYACYIRNNVSAGNKAAFGVVDALTVFSHLYTRTAGNNLMIGVNNATTNASQSGVASVGGLYQGTRVASNNIKGYRGITEVISSTQASGASPQLSCYVLSRNALGSAQAFSDANIAYLDMGDGILPTQVLDKYYIIQMFQTMLSRNV